MNGNLNLACGDVVLIFHSDTLGLRGGLVSTSFKRVEGRVADQTYHVIDLVHADQPRRKLEHVVAQRNDDELGVLGALLDVSSDDRNLGER
jgi:hypothetical protein